MALPQTLGSMTSPSGLPGTQPHHPTARARRQPPARTNWPPAHDPLNPGVARERPVVPGSPFELPFKVGQEPGNPIHFWVRGGRHEVVQIAGPG